MTPTPPRGTPKNNNPTHRREEEGGRENASSHGDRGGATSRTDLNEVYRLLAESVQDYAIFALDSVGRVLTWSAGAARIKGYARTEIVGKHFSVFYPPEAIAAGLPDRELEIARRVGRLEDEGWRVRKDGSQFWANVIITALHDELGQLVGFAKVTRDLTARRVDDEELRRSEERFRLLVETVRDYAIFMLDPLGYVATWNAGAERIKGYQAPEIIGRHFSVFYPAEKVAVGFPQHELAVAAREGRFEDEGWRVRKDGSQFWANVVITALRDQTGKLVGFAKVTRDLTERRALEEQGRRLAAEEAARAESERRNRELQQLSDQLQEQAIEIEHQKEEAQTIAEQFEQANVELELARGRLTQVFEQAPVAVVVLRGRVASDLVFHLVNPRYEELIPRGRERMGRRLADVLTDTDAPLFQILQRVLDTGEPFIATEYAVSLDRDGDGVEEPYYFNFVYHPLKEGTGEVSGVVGIGTEVTESVRARKAAEELRRAADVAREVAEAAERRVAFLAEASARLAVSMDVESTLGTIAELAVPVLADWCFVEVLDRGRVRPVAVTHREPAMVQLAHEVLTRYPIDLDAPFGTGKVLRSGEAELNPDIHDEALRAVAQDEEHLTILRRVGFRSSLSVPLKDAAGRSVAVLSLVSAESGRRFGDADLAMAQELAGRAAAALARAKLYAAGQAALRRAIALQRVSSALVGALSENDVADVVVRHGCEAVGAAAGSFALLDGDQRTFRIIASTGYDNATAAAFRQFPVVAGRPVSDAVLRDTAVYQPSLKALDAEYPYTAPVLQGSGLEAYVALPVRAGARPVAALSFSFSDERDFDAEDRAFFETLAAQAGQALDRARLVEAERTARAEAETARAAAEEANRAKSEFLATMSHELRTPLNAIAGYAELLEMGLHGPLTAEQRQSIIRIQRSQVHLTGLINEVLSYARLESGMVTYDVRPIVLADVVATAVTLVEPQRAAKRIALEVRDPARAGGSAIRALADSEKVQQIMLNLLSNALKFTPESGRVEIDLVPAPNERGMVVLRVSDTGIGIPQDKLEAIFEPFVQVGRSLRAPGEGTGLGLAISRDLARAMGGEITATSEPGHGATFTVQLPAA
jgi:PAS domain S-box-containing protein